MKTEDMINSDNYWDSRFEEDWEVFEGPAQSRFFSRLAIENLPSWLLEQLQRQPFTLCDWGCAQGDGTDVWASYLDAARITGIDFSSVAIEQASQRYPAITFLNEDWLVTQPDKHSVFDVIFSSNTLEHFHEPYEVLKAISSQASKAIVLAVPYRELERHSEHFYTFFPENIPTTLSNGFRIVWSKVVDCRQLPGALWDGEQIILVYAKSDWVDELGLRLKDFGIEQGYRATEIRNLTETLAQRKEQIEALHQALVQRKEQNEVLNQNVAQRESQIQELNQAVAQRDAKIQELSQAVAQRESQIQELNQSMAQRENQIQELNQTVAQRDEKIQELSQAVTQRENQIQELNQTVAQRESQIQELNQTVAHGEAQIEALNQNVTQRESQIQELNQTVAHGEAQIEALNQTVIQRKERIEALDQGLNQNLVLREERIQVLSQTVAHREEAIQALSQDLAQRDQQIVSQQAKLMKISNWAAKIDSRPIEYAFKKTTLRVARGMLRAIPITSTTKQKLRNAFFSAIRLFRQSVPRHADQSRQEDNIVQPNTLPGPVNGERDVFVFAVIDWHFRMQRPQHIARSLAERGCRVFYFSNHFIDADTPGYQLERLPGADALFQVKLHVKGAPAIYFDAPSEQALDMLARSVAKVIQAFGALSSISIVQHAYWYPLVKGLPNSYRVYDCMDHHEGFGNVPARLVEIEKEMLGNADVVTVTSAWLEDFARAYNPNVALVRNATEYDHFAMQPGAVYQDSKGRRVIGYYGAIAEWFDLELLRAVALEYSDCLVLLVGNDTVGAKKALADLPNVVFTGEVPYVTLPFYLHAFDVCLLPFKVIPLTLATNPVKVYEYLAAGKPVVCVDLPEVDQFGNLVLRACSSDAFVLQVGVALQESDNLAMQNSAERCRFASEQTWSDRAAEIATALGSIQMPRISVIILTFNNIELTRACLDSVMTHSDYPNLEIIVVDNASSDGTQAYLEDFIVRHPDVQIVLNPENLGFAAGNNVGLSIATGDYLVLLNNDTVVTKGWLMTLLRHFQNDPNLGLLGPVTNNIGNEARINISYDSMADMQARAAEYTLFHPSFSIPLRTAAFFCVMIPRTVYDTVGPLDEAFGRGFFEDDDYCRRVETLGLKIACAEDVFVHHHLSASFNKLKQKERQRLFNENKKIYEAKWGEWVPHTYRDEEDEELSQCLV